MRILALTPMLQVRDMEQTIAWYQTTLGFRVADRQDQDWCRLERDQVSIMFMKNAHLGPPNATATQYFEVDDVMGLWSLVSETCPAEWGPDEMPYGMLEFAIRDPNGYLLSFGQAVDQAGP